MIFDIVNHKPSPGSKYLIDTNILIYLYCPMGNHKPKIQSVYSSYLNKLVQNKCELYVTSQILSEFINRYFRIGFEFYQSTNGKNKDYKNDYRTSAEFRKTHATMIPIIKSQILKLCRRLDDQFTAINLDEVFKNSEFIDHNDAYYAEIMTHYNVGILTHDGDFSHYKDRHDIYTANGKLIF